MSAAVTPRDCALAVTLPLTERRFMDDLRAPEHDYAAYIRSLHVAEGAEDRYYWDFVYAPFAALMNETCDAIVARGVTVVRNATLDDLRRLTAEFRIVTFVSHWRFRALRATDGIDGAALLDAVRGADDGLAVAFRDAILAHDAGALSAGTERLVDAINAVLRDAHASYVTDEREPLLLMKILPWRLTRAALDKAFPDAIVPARAVEFADGMKTAAEVVRALAPAFNGLLDLTVCNSAILGDIIKAERPSCTVAVNRYPAEPHVRLVLYSRVIDELARRPAPFADALTRFGKRE